MAIVELNNIPDVGEAELLAIVNAGLEFSKPAGYLGRYVEKLSSSSIRVGEDVVDLSNGNLYVLGWGKVSGAMAHALEGILGPDMIEEGVVVTSNPDFQTDRIQILEGTHPLPSEQNVVAAKQIMGLAERCTEDDYVICLASGGGSAILCSPVEGISLDDKVAATDVMLKAGMEVEHINRIRKHLSAVKGGQVAKAIHPARMANLVVSDDIADQIHSVGSGPTSPDPITFRGAQEIIERYGLREELPASVVDYIDRNVGRTENETLKPDEARGFRITTHMVFNNAGFRNNLRVAAEALGHTNIVVYPDTLSGDFDDALARYVSFIEQVDPDSDYLVIGGGEVEVKSQPGGKGGRAQHFAAAMIPKLFKWSGEVTFAAVASDGHDYLPGIAGAIVTGETNRRMLDMEVPYEQLFAGTQSFEIHRRLGSHLLTVNPTQTNVFDAYIFMRRK
tara:strand:- start:271 stop:1617 length:1347 start_codon:yes stop_codon:yes gene_type:complete